MRWKVEKREPGHRHQFSNEMQWTICGSCHDDDDENDVDEHP